MEQRIKKRKLVLLSDETESVMSSNKKTEARPHRSFIASKMANMTGFIDKITKNDIDLEILDDELSNKTETPNKTDLVEKTEELSNKSDLVEKTEEFNVLLNLNQNDNDDESNSDEEIVFEVVKPAITNSVITRTHNLAQSQPGTLSTRHRQCLNENNSSNAHSVRTLNSNTVSQPSISNSNVNVICIDPDDPCDPKKNYQSGSFNSVCLKNNQPITQIEGDTDADFEEFLNKKVFDLKIINANQLEHFSIYRNQALSEIIDQIGKRFKTEPTKIVLYHDGTMVDLRKTYRSMNLTVADILQLIIRSDETEEKGEVGNREVKPSENSNDPYLIELHLNDGQRKQLTVRINRFRTVQELAQLYAKEHQIPVDSIKLSLDQVMDAQARLDSFDLENGDQVDVIVKK